jgi:CxxC motif-containing protein (DUF1111 family)
MKPNANRPHRQHRPARIAIVSGSILAVSLLSAVAVAQLLPPPPPPPGPGNPQNGAQVGAPAGFGGPLAGLSPSELAQWRAGLDEFTNIETPEGGLGPLFNGRSCVECHRAPVVGGASRIVVTRFGRTENEKFDPLDSLGGSLLQRFATRPELREVIPHEANVVAQRITTPVFGLGLIEAIPDSAIVANALLPRSDGVAGRAAEITDVVSGERRVGRLGWKAQHASVLAFAADAYNNEMGVTNRFFPTENAPNGNQALLQQFTRRNPGIEDTVDANGRSDVDAAADYMRFLAAPPRGAITSAVLAGESIFLSAGCASCHTPSMRTGPSRTAALDRKVVSLYSDLLLHDMGRLGDGIAQANAKPNEMKTAPLWGLRVRDRYLHDGRATSVDAAIRAHEGSAVSSRDRYSRLSAPQRQQLLEFLGSL